MFYWSLKSVPELQRRSVTERRQAAWQIGLKPLFHWEVWAALFATGFLMLWGLETLTGNMFFGQRHAGSHARLALWAAGAALIVYLSRLIYVHVSIKTMRPSMRRVSYDNSEGWLSAWLKSAFLSLVSGCLMLGSVLAVDWAINSYDASPAPQFVALKNWPKHVPDDGNGFFPAAGLMAPSGASAAEAGERWVAAVNEAAIRHAGEYPAPPHGLTYVPYAERDGAAPRPGRAGGFCDAGSEPCWKVWDEQKAGVEAWLAANRELLERYQSLQKYPQWQFAVMTEDDGAPAPSYDALLKGQSLYLAAAMREMSKGLSGKKPPAKWQVELFGRGLDRVGDDIALVRTLLAGNDRLSGKQAAVAMLARDMALISETAAAYPRDVRAHWEKIQKMFQPFAEDQVSVADGFKFEEKIASSQGQARYAQLVSRAPRLLRPWLAHHYKPNDSGRTLAAYWENVLRETAVNDAARTPPLPERAAPVLPRLSRWTGFLHNQGGKLMLLEFSPRYLGYANQMFDLNAMNALLRVRAEIGVRHLTPNGVPGFLSETAGNKSLLDPETGKPFEWDAVRKELYFTPATELTRARYGLDSAGSGRVGVRVQ